MMTVPAAVLFDMDGLLVDSEPLWYEVEQAVMARLGGRWGPEHQAACVGGPLRRTAAYLVRLAGSAEDPADVERELVDRMADRLAGGVPLRPGAADLLRGLAAAGIPCALVSSSFRRLVDSVLVGLPGGWFGVSVAGDEVTHPKPDPEPYRRAARLLGVEPARCVALEDSLTGVTSAEAAGCLCVAVPDLVPVPAALRRPVLGSLTEIDAGWLLGLPDRLRPAS